MSRETSIATYTGKMIDLLHPEAALIDIRDIAHALSNIARFTGHTARHFSVAEHSIHASHLGLGDPLVCLLHDSAEAYLGDVATPFKHLLRIDDFGAGRLTYRELEGYHLTSIGVAFDCPSIVDCHGDAPEKIADVVMLAAEASILMDSAPKSTFEPWTNKVAKYKDLVESAMAAIQRWGDQELTPADVERRFLHRFKELKVDLV